jgi:hypothetical protein
MKALMLFFGLCLGSPCFTAIAEAGTELNFWHSYIHQPDGVTHYSFHIANHKRGLFFGSCGPSTRSLRWEYNVDLSGSGPVYQKDQIAVTVAGKPVAVGSGTITIDAQKQNGTMSLQLEHGAAKEEFVGNGRWGIKRAR